MAKSKVNHIVLQTDHDREDVQYTPYEIRAREIIDPAILPAR